MQFKRGLRALNSGIFNTLSDNLHSFCVESTFWVFAVLKAVFMNCPNALDFSYVWMFRNVQMCFFHWNHTSHNGEISLRNLSTLYLVIDCVQCWLSTHQTSCSSLFLTLFAAAHWVMNRCMYTIQQIQKEPSQNLRSALEEKARKQQPGPTKPKRKMKPGQAKTISDLPQLSAWG